MHKIEEIEKALKLLDAYDGQLSKTARALGINRYTLRLWRDKRKKGEPLILKTRNKSSRWSKDEQEPVIEYYLSHSENITKTCRKFGYPSASTLKLWVKKIKHGSENTKFIKRHLYNLSSRIKTIKIIGSNQFISTRKTPKIKKCPINRTTLYINNLMLLIKTSREYFLKMAEV